VNFHNCPLCAPFKEQTQQLSEQDAQKTENTRTNQRRKEAISCRMNRGATAVQITTARQLLADESTPSEQINLANIHVLVLSVLVLPS